MIELIRYPKSRTFKDLKYIKLTKLKKYVSITCFVQKIRYAGGIDNE